MSVDEGVGVVLGEVGVTIDGELPRRRRGRWAEGTGVHAAVAPANGDRDSEPAPDDDEIVLFAAAPVDPTGSIAVAVAGADTARKVRRRTKRDRPRSKTIAMKRVTRAELQLGALMYPPVEDLDRPRTRAQCMEEARPCPWVSCKHHLYLDINPETGSIKINFPDLEPWEMKHTCSLDVAENGALTLEEIGLITNLTRERIRQVEVRGLLKLKARREIR